MALNHKQPDAPATAPTNHQLVPVETYIPQATTRSLLRACGSRFVVDESGRLLLVDLRGTTISNEWLENLSRYSELEELRLPIQIGDDGIRNIRTLDRLRRLAANYTEVSDRGAAWFRYFHRLTEVNLSFTRVSDAALESLQHVRTLQLVDIRGTRVTRGGIEAFQRQRPSCVIRTSLRLSSFKDDDSS